MPAVSKAQFRYMAAVASGRIKVKGLSREQAREWLSANYRNLPERAGKRGAHR